MQHLSQSLLWAGLFLLSSSYRIENHGLNEPAKRVLAEPTKTSSRAFTWRASVDFARFKLRRQSDHHEAKRPFLALPAPSQNNPCKLIVYEDSGTVLIQPPSVLKKHVVSTIKAQLAEVCKLVNSNPEAAATAKTCAALNLNTEEGRAHTLSTGVHEDDAAPEDAENGEADDHEDDTLDGTATPALKATQESLKAAVSSYVCLALKGPDLQEGVSAKGAAPLSGMVRAFKRGVRELTGTLKGSAIARLAKKLAGYGHGVCPPFSTCPKWRRLLKSVVPEDGVHDYASCQEHLMGKGLLELKGLKGKRLAAIDLTGLDAEGVRRFVTPAQSDGSVTLHVRNDLEEENVTSISFGQAKKKLSRFHEYESDFNDLFPALTKRIEECKVEKVGVFNMGLKRTLNSFQISERFPWKALFLSSISIQIFTDNAHGKHFGYDLHGDPEEIERPCKWMQKSLEKGYEPRNWWFPASSINFDSLHKSIKIPSALWKPSDNQTLLWVDEEGKFPMPEWIRGMRKIYATDTSDWPDWMYKFNDGRNLDHYIEKMAFDVRGLHDAQDSEGVLSALKALGWKSDPIVRIHPIEGSAFWEKTVTYTDQDESVQISSKLVTSVYPYTKKLAELQSLPTDIVRNGGENKIWSIYDYTESYVESCFVVEALSLPFADDDADGWTDIGGRITASMTFCANNFASEKRSMVPEASFVDRKDVMKELISFFSRGRPEGLQVAAKLTRKCSSESDCSGNTCMSSGDCKENEDSPCPVGYGCSCDTSKNEMLFTVAVGASMLTEVVQNSVILGPSWIAACEAVSVAGVAATGGLSLGLAPLCPVLMPIFFSMLAPLGSDVALAFIFASIVGGLNTCGCVPLTCSSSSLLSDSVCALKHPSEEAEMINPYHFVPPPNKKCVPGAAGCWLKDCNATDKKAAKVGWQVQNGRLWGQGVGVYNCRQGEFDPEDTAVVQQFDYKQFAEDHKEFQQLQTSLVPQFQAPEKLSLLDKYTVALPQDLRHCFTPGYNSTARNALKMAAAPACAVWSVTTAVLGTVFDIVGKILEFTIDLIVNVLKFVRGLIFVIFSVLHKHLAGQRVWCEECEAVGFSVDQTPAEAAPTSLLDAGSILFEAGSFCLEGGSLRPCHEMDKLTLQHLYS